MGTCVRVEAAWRLLQRKISTLLNGWRRLSIEDLLKPSLRNVARWKKTKILKMFASYVVFIMDNNNVIDVDSLEFEIDNAV